MHWGTMARQQTDVIPLDEQGPMDYKFRVGEREYRIRFEQGVWVLAELGEEESQDKLSNVRLDSMAEGVHLALAVEERTVVFE